MAIFHPRGEWGGRTPTGGRIGQVSTVVIHHTAAQGAPTYFDPQRWRNLENGQVRSGYSSFAYHFGVVNGPIAEFVEARGWGNKGAATGGNNPAGGYWNDTSVAIVVDGYFHPDVNDVVTPQALDAAADVILNGIYLGFISKDFRCIPHSEASQGTKWATACPGDNLRGLVNHPFGSIEAIAKYKLGNAAAVAPEIVPPPAPPTKPRCVNTCANRTLRLGSSGVCVTTLQRLLTARGFNTNGVDGRFGNQTLAAVKCAQQANGISPDGVVGPQTWNVLG